MGTLQSYSCRIPAKTSKQLSFFSTNPWPSMSWNPSACRCSSRIHWRAEFGIPWKKRSKRWWSKIDLSAVPRQHNTWRLPSKFRKTLPQQNWCDKQVSSWRHISCRTDKNRYYTWSWPKGREGMNLHGCSSHEHMYALASRLLSASSPS